LFAFELRGNSAMKVSWPAGATSIHTTLSGKRRSIPNLPIFQAGNGKPLNLDNLVRRVIVPALTRCAVCGKREDEHAKAEHEFKLDTSTPSWHGWHAFRRGLATNLPRLGVDDKTIQAILRHSNVALTINVYIKSVSELQVNAMDVLQAKFSETSNNLPTGSQRLVN
jgi:integrase